jgi:hypothetical protein
MASCRPQTHIPHAAYQVSTRLAHARPHTVRKRPLTPPRSRPQLHMWRFYPRAAPSRDRRPMPTTRIHFLERRSRTTPSYSLLPARSDALHLIIEKLATIPHPECDFSTGPPSLHTYCSLERHWRHDVGLAGSDTHSRCADPYRSQLICWPEHWTR